MRSLAESTTHRERNKKHPQKSNTKIFSLPLSPPPLKIVCVCIFPAFQGENQKPEHKEFQGLKAPKRRWIQGMGFLVKSLCLGVFSALKLRDRKGTPKNIFQNDFAELLGDLSGAICLKTLVWLGSALELFRKFFGALRVIFWLWVLSANSFTWDFFPSLILGTSILTSEWGIGVSRKLVRIWGLFPTNLCGKALFGTN